ncbi:hypothetical protein HPB47_028098 [Ixodes persulcatus]|uniref:Uncharacterized protein n=1 Tax=Ixodes persulcatus TaxID=34615 RepID=A0AC60PU56_IXOPE|nr:hypothetical protein HPB47_028098 [Ixodes persulcatus]
MTEVWAVTLKSTDGVRRTLATPELTVKGRLCLTIDPENQDVRIKLLWLLFNVLDDDVRAALAPYKTALEVVREM